MVPDDPNKNHQTTQPKTASTSTTTSPGFSNSPTSSSGRAAQAHAELALFLTTQHRWSPECGFHAYLDSLSFTAPRTAKSDEEQHAVTGPGVRPARLRRTGGYW
ncbi:hypothetical protein EEB14_45710 [Rhodococcus sp. WS4]|nr:hypothetical protein EEB14_45710 [Rhodococcus sp. WS4]